MFKGPVICKFKSITETVINFTNLFDFKLINWYINTPYWPLMWKWSRRLLWMSKLRFYYLNWHKPRSNAPKRMFNNSLLVGMLFTYIQRQEHKNTATNMTEH